MGPTKIMIIRHAEKPGTYGGNEYKGINAAGKKDKESLITLGWERAGGIANLFDPPNSQFQHPALAQPDFIYASDPATDSKEPSQRPYQTVSALARKLNVQPNTCFRKNHYINMVTAVLALDAGNQKTCTILISWQHEDILPKETDDASIVGALIQQTGSTNLSVPTQPWPEDRYDLVFVFDRPSGSGAFTGFTQVPQMLLAGDSTVPIP